MWFLILQDVEGEREVFHTHFTSRANALAAIKGTVLFRPNTVRVLVCKANDDFKIHLDVSVLDIDGSEVV